MVATAVALSFLRASISTNRRSSALLRLLVSPLLRPLLLLLLVPLLPPTTAQTQGHFGPVWDVSYGRLGCRFVTASQDRTARLWDDVHAAPLRTFEGHTYVRCVFERVARNEDASSGGGGSGGGGARDCVDRPVVGSLF